MANSFTKVDTWLAYEGLDLLLNKLACSQFFNKEYSKEFRRNFATGESIRVPFPDRGVIRNGLTYDPTAITRRYATVTFDDPFGSDFEYDDIEAIFDAPRGKEKLKKELLTPRIEQIAQEIDSRCALYAYRNAASVVGALGTDPSTYDATSAAARQIMAELACPPDGDKGMIVPPAVHRAVKASNIALHNPVTDITKQFRSGIVGHADGFDWYESMSLYQHTAGTWQGAVSLASGASDGATTLSLTCTTGDTFKVGDKFSISAVRPVNPMTRRTFRASTYLKTFTCLGNGSGSDVTGASSAATITISPAVYGPDHPWQNVDALPLASATLTLWPGTTSPNGKSGVVGLALHNKAFALVGAELPMPKGSSVELADKATDPDSGIEISFIRQFDGRARKMINRFDCQIGFGSFYNDSCAVAVACG